MIFLAKKILENMTFFSNVPKRWNFQKNCTGIWSFSYYLERWYFFRKHDIFPLGGKWKMIFLKKYIEIWYFLYERAVATPPAKKTKNDRSPQKYTSRWLTFYIDTLERAPIIFCTSTGDLTGVSIYCFSAKKTQETQYIGLEFDFFFNLFGRRYSTMKNLQYFVPFSNSLVDFIVIGRAFALRIEKIIICN